MGTTLVVKGMDLVNDSEDEDIQYNNDTDIENEKQERKNVIGESEIEKDNEQDDELVEDVEKLYNVLQYHRLICKQTGQTQAFNI